jgi:uncharacterized protein
MQESSSSTPVIHTVVLQPTPFCNINCRYCYLPDRNATTVMALETAVTSLGKIFASGWCSPEITVIWHAGEPLVLPVSYYRAAFEAIEAIRPDSVHVRHSFQTNGMLINQEWCDFAKEWHIGIGVSVDGPQHIHDIHRVTRSGAGTFERTIAGVRLLRREGVPFHVISVLSEAGMQAPEEMLDFYISEGIEDVCFNVEESEGDHTSTLLAGDHPEQRFRYFLDRFWALARQTSDIHFIREIDTMIPRIFRPAGTHMGNIQVEPLGMVNIDCHGNVSSFSPELLGLKNDKYNDFIIGNIHSDSLLDMMNSPAMLSMGRDIAAGVSVCQAECDYFSVCGGGSPVNKLTENGSFATGRTGFCSLVQMVPTDLILSALDRLEHRVSAGYAPERPLRDPGQAPSTSRQPAPPRRTAANNFVDVRDIATHQIQRSTQR